MNRAPRDVFSAALRVLTAWTARRRGAPADVAKLREFSQDFDSDEDDLACRIIDATILPTAAKKAANGK